jgi:hypothetical protein
MKLSKASSHAGQGTAFPVNGMASHSSHLHAGLAMDGSGAKFKGSQVNTGQVRPGDEPSQSQVGASESKEEPKEV